MAGLGGTFGNKVILDPVKLAELLRGPQGPVFRDLMEKGQRVLVQARDVEAPRSTAGPALPNQYRRGKARQPGDLARSIVMRVATWNGEPAVYVGTPDPIGAFVHNGTPAHVITPVRATHLVFFSAKAGKVIHAKRVQHPGTRPNRFLLRALRVIGR